MAAYGENLMATVRGCDRRPVLQLISIDYTGTSSMAITPTPQGRSTVETYKRIQGSEPSGNTDPLLSALTAQAAAVNKLAWPAVRPVLSALRDYWMDGGFSIHGIQMPALLLICPPELRDLFTATVRALVSSGYLESTSSVRRTRVRELS